MSNKSRWIFLAIYLALFGSYCGLEIDTFVGDTPLFRIRTLLLLVDVLWVLLVPPVFYSLFASIPRLWNNALFRIGFLFLSAIHFHYAAYLAVYKAVRKTDFDFYFLYYNTADALPALWKLYAPWFPVVILSIAAFIFWQKPAFSPLMRSLRKSPRKTSAFMAAVFLGSLACQWATIHSIRGSASGFMYSSFFSDRRLRNDYGDLYQKHIAALRADAPKAAGSIDPSPLGDVIFFIKQESLNAFLLKDTITPQLLRASKDGILFPKFYGNSIQSLRGYECILCGVPPSVSGALVDDYSAAELSDLRCLPKIFRALGYHSLYLFGGSRNARIVHFAESIGFEKVLADDIVRPGDFKFDWGYREDIFFTRIHEYLERYHPGDKLFVFIDTGATNHTPFEVLDNTLKDKVPFPRPITFTEHISNTTFVQDAYFGRFYGIYSRYYARRGCLLAISDHAWPIMMQKDNIYNERGAYEENFLIPMVFVPPSDRKALFATGSIVPSRFSQMDIFPTILELMGMQQPHLLGESFAPWLLAAPQRMPAPPAKVKICVQPYGGGFISAVRYPEKSLFDVLGRNVKVYNLEKDPLEQFPRIRDVGQQIPLLRNFFLGR